MTEISKSGILYIVFAVKTEQGNGVRVCFFKEDFIVWTPLPKCIAVSSQNTLERRLTSARSSSLLIFIWKIKLAVFKSVIYYDAQTSNINIYRIYK